MLLPIDEAGWRSAGVQFIATAQGYRFLIPPGPGNPPAADAGRARDRAGALLLSADGREQLDLQPERYSPHRALVGLLTGPQGQTWTVRAA